LGVKDWEVVLIEPRTEERVADGRNFTVAPYCGDTKGDWDNFPEELFGRV
jgi:hypothetical protein